MSNEVNNESADNESALRDQVAALTAKVEYLTSELEYARADLAAKRGRVSIHRQAYRKIYYTVGAQLRGILPGRWVDSIRARVPHAAAAASHVQASGPPASWLDEFGKIGPAGEGCDVFVLSIIDWDFRTQRPQHIARGLSAKHRVFFVEMSLAPDGNDVRKVGDNIYVVRLGAERIGALRPYSGRLSRRTIRAWLSTFDRFCEAARATGTKHVVIEHPFWWQIARHMPGDYSLVFDCMDDIAGFSNTSPSILELERDMIAHCDKLVVSSQKLFERNKGVREPALIRNGADIDHFLHDRGSALPAFLKARDFAEQSRKLRVGYVGAIAEWFDVDLLEELARNEPGIELHLCGAVSADGPNRLKKLDNVHMYGEVPYADVPAFLERMDVLVIPFRLLPIIEATDPVKFYEYAAMGKPTVSTRLPELARAGDLVFFAATAREFADQIRAAAKKAEDPAFRDRLRAYARENTWADRVAQFERVLDDFPKVSVVILHYGDPSLTEAALRSLHERGGHYPALEVLLVDNGSGPEVLAEIRRQAERYDDVRLIENGVNLGFAGGNNVGIAAATGDYVLLLNNDTYLAPGAVHAMVRHLERHPEVGVVGPLTNNIGNEAKVHVAYADMAAMRRTARQLTTGYRGMSTPLRMVAYFAAMFRRSDFAQFGTLDTGYGIGTFEDDDHCAVVRSKGYVCALAEDAFVHHHLSATFSTIVPEKRKAMFERNKATFEARWGRWTAPRYRLKRPRSAL